jgi:putative Mg2+ transporter-C (MgtC) family protein
MDIYLQLTALLKIIFAVFLGGLVGLEREFSDKPAGLRTHMLAVGAATLLVMLGDYIGDYFGPNDLIRTDPIRIIQAIVVGISFLGAGTIIKHVRDEDEDIEGLTTGASILAAAAIGIAVALDLYWLAVGVTVLILFITWVLDYIVKQVRQRTNKL